MPTLAGGWKNYVFISFYYLTWTPDVALVHSYIMEAAHMICRLFCWCFPLFNAKMSESFFLASRHIVGVDGEEKAADVYQQPAKSSHSREEKKESTRMCCRMCLMNNLCIIIKIQDSQDAGGGKETFTCLKILCLSYMSFVDFSREDDSEAAHYAGWNWVGGW